MDSTIQLIQLSLRIEREAERQRRLSTVHRDDLANDKPVGRSKRGKRVKGSFYLLYRQRQCECA
jgi:hypothetical protein